MISGLPAELCKELVAKARKEELDTIRDMKVWRHVPRAMCLSEAGRPPIKLRWVDINKGDDLCPK